MAAPTVRAATAPAAGGSVTSPSSTAVDDLVIVYTWEQAGAGIPTHTLQSGFVEIRSHGHNDGSTDGRLSVAYKIATSAGANSYQAYTTSTGSPIWYTGCVVVTAGTYDVTTRSPATDANSITSTTTVAPDPPVCPATGTFPLGDYLCFCIGAWHLGSSLTLTPIVPTFPTNWTNQGDVAGSAQGDVCCCTLAQTAITSINPNGFGDNQTPNGTVAMTFVIAAKGATLVSVNQATESDVAQTVTWAPKNRLIGQITETDLSQVVTRIKSQAIGQTIETDLAQIVTVVTGASGHFVNVLQASETDFAQAATAVRTYLLGQALELSSAQALRALKLVGVLQATETDSALSITIPSSEPYVMSWCHKYGRAKRR